MAQRPYFRLFNNNPFYKEQLVEFDFFSGFAISQKIKSVESMHASIKKIIPGAKILEVSTKSSNPIGYRLSAFNLCYTFSDGAKYPVECVFQSSKVFEGNKRFLDLLYRSPKEAKTDGRLKTSGTLTHFELDGESWGLEPKTSFYDFLYISALMQDQQLCDELLQFDTFTDIEFNPQRSFNCQARSVAIFVSLQKQNILNTYLKNKQSFLNVYLSSNAVNGEQIKLF